MAKAQTYIKDIRAQVKANHGGKVPEYLNLTIKMYAKALELKDHYEDTMLSTGGPLILENGSMGNIIRKQHPLCNLIYQQESICQKYAKDLGLTAAKAAMKIEAPDTVEENDSMRQFYENAKK